MSSFLPLIIISAAVTCFVTFINTNFALVILIFSMLLSPEIPLGAIADRTVVIRIDDILIFIVFFTWLLKLAMNKELGLLRRTVLNSPIKIYMVVLIIATLLGIFNGYVNMARAFFFLLKYFEYFILFFMVSNNVKSRKQVKVFIFFILLTAMITCIFAIHQRGYAGRLSAPFEGVEEGRGEPNTLGGYLMFISALIAGLLLYNRDPFIGLFLSGLAGLVLFTLSGTLSRGSYLGFMAVFLALTILTTKKRAALIFLMLLFILSHKFILPPKVIERVTKTFIPDRVYEPWPGVRINLDYSASARLESWRWVLRRWQANPILGYGVTGSGFIDTQFPLVLAETGIVGLAAYIWLLVTIFKASLQVFKSTEDNYFRGLCLGFIAGFIGLFIHSFSAATFIVIRIMEPFWFLAATVLMLPEVKNPTQSLP